MRSPYSLNSTPEYDENITTNDTSCRTLLAALLTNYSVGYIEICNTLLTHSRNAEQYLDCNMMLKIVIVLYLYSRWNPTSLF